MNEIDRYIAQELGENYPVYIDTLTGWILSRAAKRDGVAAILFYGSGLWQDDAAGVVWDLHVLVDEYTDFDPSVALAAAGSLLPHNVYYMQDTDAEHKQLLHCKFNVMRMDQFENHAQGHAITPQIWARFCQPCRLAYIRDDADKVRVIKALSDCSRTFLKSALPLVDGQKKCDWREVWQQGFAETYRDEWRSEGKDRSETIIAASEDAFKKRTSLLFNENEFDAYFIDDDNIRIEYSSDYVEGQRRKRKWVRPLKKAVALMRLIKASFTFDNAMEYAAWKIERHSGYKVHLTPFQKKHAVLGGAPLLWKLWRKGVLK